MPNDGFYPIKVQLILKKLGFYNQWLTFNKVYTSKNGQIILEKSKKKLERDNYKSSIKK